MRAPPPPPDDAFPPLSRRLESKLLAGVGRDGALDVGGSEKRVAVRDLGEGSGRGRVGAAAEADVSHDGVPGGVAVGVVDGLGAARLEDAALHEELGSLARVDRRAHVVVVRVEDVAGAEAERGPAAVEVLEV